MNLYRLYTTLAPDFHVLWSSAGDLLVGNNPYLNPNIFTGVGYPINTLLFYLPLTKLPYTIAQGIFLTFSLISLIGAVFLSLKLVYKKIDPKVFILVLFLAAISFPVKFTLGMGQNNLIAFLLLLISFYFSTKNKNIKAGIFLGLAYSLKTIFLFFLVFFLLTKKFKTLYYSFLVFLTSVVTVSLISNFGFYQYWLSEVIPPLLNLEGREIYYNQGFIGFFSRFIANLELRKYVNYFFSIVLLSVLFQITKRAKDINLKLSSFVVTLPLIDTLSWQHHFSWLIFPFVVLMGKVLKSKKIFLIALLFISYFLVSFNFSNPPLVFNFFETLVYSHVFIGTALLLVLIYLLN